MRRRVRLSLGSPVTVPGQANARVILALPAMRAARKENTEWLIENARPSKINSRPGRL